MTLTPLFARSIGDVILAGFADGTITVRRFPAKSFMAPSARPLSTNFFGLVVSAERKMSAGAPCSIWVSSAADESVEIVSVEPGWVDSQAVLILSRAPLSEAAP